MEDQRFDDLTKRLAHPVSRQRLLKTAVAATIGGLFMGRGGQVLAGGNSACAHFCNNTFPPGPDRGSCKSDAAKGMGLCYSPCGPNGSGGTLCGGPAYSTTTCCATTECATGTCVSGTCSYTYAPTTTPCSGSAPCNSFFCSGTGTCVPTDVPDGTYCGHNGDQCAMTCVAGTCTTGPCCPGNQRICNGLCTDLSSDPTNCGTCGTVCGVGTTCVQGVCTTA